MINAVAQFERDLLVERTQSGLARARADGKRLGRPYALGSDAQAAVLDGLERGESVSALARQHRTSRQTVMRLRNAALKDEMGGIDVE